MGSSELSRKRGDASKKAIEIAERRQLVAKYVLRKLDQSEIAVILKRDHPAWDCSQATVSRDIAWLKAKWRQEAQAHTSTFQARELAELDNMEKLAIDEFEITRKAHWLNVRLSIKERRAKLLGLDAAIKQEISGKDGAKLEIVVNYASDSDQG